MKFRQCTPVVLLGTGMSVPDRVLTNKDLEKIVDTSDEWIPATSGFWREQG